MANQTILFKTIVPTYEEFINVSQADYARNYCNIIINDGTTKTLKFIEWCPRIYYMLLQRYRNWEIAYENVDDFLDTLWERITQFAPTFYVKDTYYKRILELGDIELKRQGYSISNFIEHTDEKIANPLSSLLNNITNQNNDVSFTNDITAFRNAIANAKYVLIDDFCKQFKSLFLQVYTSPNYYG